MIILSVLLISPVLAQNLIIEKISLDEHIALPGGISFGKVKIKNIGTSAEEVFLEITVGKGILQRSMIPDYIKPQKTIERLFYYKIPENARGKTNLMVKLKYDSSSVSENNTIFVIEPIYSFDGSLNSLSGWLPNLYLEQGEKGKLKLLIVNTGTLEDFYVLNSSPGVYVNDTRFLLNPLEYKTLDVVIDTGLISPGLSEIKINVCSKGNNECKEFMGSVDLGKKEESTINFTETPKKTVQLLVSNDGNTRQEFDINVIWDGISRISPKSFTLFPQEFKIVDVNLTGASDGIASLVVLANNKTIWEKQINFTMPEFVAEINDIKLNLNWIFYVLAGVLVFVGIIYFLRARRKKREYQYWK